MNKWAWLIPIGILALITLTILTLFVFLAYSIYLNHLAGVISSGIALLLCIVVWTIILTIFIKK